MATHSAHSTERSQRYSQVRRRVAIKMLRMCTVIARLMINEFISSPRILVIGSGPGEPAATLASNFPDADVISAHTTTKCLEWANARFHKHGLTNVAGKLLPSLESLDSFADGSFDLVASCYGISNTMNPQDTLKEIHRVLKPGGSFLVSVWKNAPADPASDIILRHACVGPNPWHKSSDNRDMVGNFACPVKRKHPMRLSMPQYLETLLEEAKLSVAEVVHDEYPLRLGKTKAFAFKALTLPIQSELQELQQSNNYHCQEAAEAFEDVLKEGFMVKHREDGELEVPYNLYKFVVSRREYEDGDTAKETKALQSTATHRERTSGMKPLRIKPSDIDFGKDPVIFDTWNRIKSAASEKIVNAVKRQIEGFEHDSPVKVLDVAPTPYAHSDSDIASSHPYVSVVATSKSINIVEAIRDDVVKHGLSNLKVKACGTPITSFPEKSFDMVVCSFGLAFLRCPEETLKEFYRLLKPGSSLILSVWEDFSLIDLSNFIVNEMYASGDCEDLISPSTPDVFNQLTPYSKPHEIEHLMFESGFKVTRVDHETARIILSDASCEANQIDSEGFNLATLGIRPILQELEKTGNKSTIEKARKAFDSLIRDPSLVSRDKCGNLVTTLPSRFKIVTATRQFNDDDGFLPNDTSSPKSPGQEVIKVSDIPK